MEITDRLAHTINREIDWFKAVVDTALTLYFKNESDKESIFSIAPPDVTGDTSPYAAVIHDLNLNFEERLVLILAIVPYIKPNLLDVFLIKNQNLNSEFSEFGGVKDTGRSGFVPSLETAIFILGGHDVNRRFQLLDKFDANHPLYKTGILGLDAEQEFGIRQELKMTREYLGLFCTGTRLLPEYSTRFPAKKIHTEMNWDDLIVSV